MTLPEPQAAVLLALADRCEREEPSRLLDVQIAVAALGWRDHNKHDPARQQAQGQMLLLTEDDRLNWRQAPAFTTSLDAAVTLVPEGRGYVLRSYGDGAGSAIIADPPRDVVFGKARVGSNMALALCAAALRARAGGQP